MKRGSSLILLPLAATLASSTNLTYDYIVVGGGTCGLVVANRLSEDPNVSVLIVEAGGSVTSISAYGLAFGTDIDWAYQSVDQIYANGAPQTMRAGKALGGTSTINGMSYSRAQVDQIDAWETIGNSGWNWDNLFPYYKKHESFQIPDPERAASAHLTWELDDHGLDGPLKVGWAYSEANTSVPVTVNATFQSLGLEWNPDINGGYMNGFSAMPKEIDQAASIRADAARAYYYPYEQRPNLDVLLNTTASRLTWTSADVPTAAGVVVSSPNGATLINARKEVILSAGALVSPLILELSGIGNPDILGKFGIETVVDLPTVGENLQDQVLNTQSFSKKGNVTVKGGQGNVAYPSVSQVFGNATSTVAQNVKDALPSYASQVAAANNDVTSADDLLDFFNLQYDLIFTSQIPLAELGLSLNGDAWSTWYWSLLPFSRGNLHINGNSTTGALIDPKYFMLGFDTDMQVATSQFARTTFQTAPLSDYVGGEESPGSGVATDDQWADWVKQNYRSNYHAVGTAAMMPQDKGGVVDTQMKVYGTANVRVMDASVLPLQVCGHTVSTLYAVAERLADLIKSG